MFDSNGLIAPNSTDDTALCNPAWHRVCVTVCKRA